VERLRPDQAVDVKRQLRIQGRAGPQQGLAHLGAAQLEHGLVAEGELLG
jgi:hypothetical protein